MPSRAGCRPLIFPRGNRARGCEHFQDSESYADLPFWMSVPFYTLTSKTTLGRDLKLCSEGLDLSSLMTKSREAGPLHPAQAVRVGKSRSEGGGPSLTSVTQGSLGRPPGGFARTHHVEGAGKLQVHNISVLFFQLFSKNQILSK